MLGGPRIVHRDAQLEVEVGFPLAEALPGDERVVAGALPAGDYATVVYIGHPSGLVDATGALLRWGDEQDVNWDVTATAEGDRWGCRLEIYGTDEPDMDKWQTELAFRLAG